MTTVVSILLSDVVSIEDRGLWQGVINILYATGAGLGGPIGGAFADSQWGWRWSFYVQVPLCVVAFFSVQKVLGSSVRRGTVSQQLARIDFMGACSLLAAVMTLLFGLDQAGDIGWNHPAVYGCLSMFPVLATVFVYIETKIASEPFIPTDLVTKRSILPSLLSSFSAFGANVSHVYFLSMYYQVSGAIPALTASLFLLSGTISEVIATLVCGYLLKKSAPLYWTNLAGYTMLAAGNVMIALCASFVKNTFLGLVVGNAVAHIGSGFGIITTLINLSECTQRMVLMGPNVYLHLP